MTWDVWDLVKQVCELFTETCFKIDSYLCLLHLFHCGGWLDGLLTETWQYRNFCHGKVPLVLSIGGGQYCLFEGYPSVMT